MSSPVLTISAKTSKASKIELSLAGSADRSHIYELRHQIYALELGQHHANRKEQLTDELDAYNIYFKASVGERMARFVSITPPGQRYSVDKYFARDVFPFAVDGGLYEVRLLTVIPEYRRMAIASLLMYAAFRWIEAHSGTRVVAIGRCEVMSLCEISPLLLTLVADCREG